MNAAVRRPKATGAPPSRRRQSGIALVIALVLLLAVTLVGLAAIRSATMQGDMAGNFLDRDIAFQNAEAALQAATASLSGTPTIWHDCSAAGTTCDANPTAAADTAGAWQAVPTGTGAAQFSTAANAAGKPQYVIENMGLWANPNTNTGCQHSAACHQYGHPPGSGMNTYYRITARSSDPTDAGGNRAVVTLQAWVRE